MEAAENVAKGEERPKRMIISCWLYEMFFSVTSPTQEMKLTSDMHSNLHDGHDRNVFGVTA